MAREGNFQDEQMEVSRVYGTKPYLPAEFLLYKILSIKVDSYSFGIVLFELATGLRAYDNRSYKYLISHIRSHTQAGNVVKENMQNSDFNNF